MTTRGVSTVRTATTEGANSCVSSSLWPWKMTPVPATCSCFVGENDNSCLKLIKWETYELFLNMCTAKYAQRCVGSFWITWVSILWSTHLLPLMLLLLAQLKCIVGCLAAPSPQLSRLRHICQKIIKIKGGAGIHSGQYLCTVKVWNRCEPKYGHANILTNRTGCPGCVLAPFRYAERKSNPFSKTK